MNIVLFRNLFYLQQTKQNFLDAVLHCSIVHETITGVCRINIVAQL